MSEDYNSELEPTTEIPAELAQASQEPSKEESNITEEAKVAKAAAAPLEQKEAPFHEHPRFKEVIEQKNQAVSAVKDLEARYRQLEATLQKMQSSAPKPADNEREAFYKSLEGINPAFAKILKDQYESTKETQTIKEQMASLQREYQVANEDRLRQAAVSEVTKLHTENKVSPEIQELYNNQLDAMARAGQLKSVEDVANAYKSIHTSYTKIFEGFRKAERESYVSAKKADSAIPSSQPKAAPAAKGKAFQYSKDPEEARAQMVQRVLKSNRESGSL